MEKQYEVKLKCIFCGSTQFEYNEDNHPADRDMIKCGNCGKMNDLSSIKKLAVDKKVSEIKTEITNEVKDKLNKMVKDFNKGLK